MFSGLVTGMFTGLNELTNDVSIGLAIDMPARQAYPEMGPTDTAKSIRTWKKVWSLLKRNKVNMTDVCNKALLAEYYRLLGKK